MAKEKLDKIAKRYAQDELKDNHGQVEDIVAAAFLNGIDYAEHHPRWISVEDELPPLNQDVLVVFGTNQDDAIGMDRIIQNIENNGYEDWELFTGITHWMPLPQAPKIGGEQ